MAKTRRLAEDIDFNSKLTCQPRNRRFLLQLTRTKILDRWKLSAPYAADEAREIYATNGDQLAIRVLGPGLKKPLTLHFRAPQVHASSPNPVYPACSPFCGHEDSRVVEIEPNSVLTIAPVQLGKKDYVIYAYSIKDGFGKTIIDPEIIVGSPDMEGPG
jgi:hypothetical protein